MRVLNPFVTIVTDEIVSQNGGRDSVGVPLDVLDTHTRQHRTASLVLDRKKNILEKKRSPEISVTCTLVICLYQLIPISRL